MYDDAYENGFDPESLESSGTRVIIKLEVVYDPLDQDHPYLWDYEDIIGPGTILLEWQDLEEDEDWEQ